MCPHEAETSIPLGIFLFFFFVGGGKRDYMGRSCVGEETPRGTELEHSPAALLRESEELGAL